MLLHSLMDFLFPRYCLMCGKRLEVEEKQLCLMCNVSLPRTYHWNNAEDNILARRYWGKIPVRKAVAYFYFRPESKPAKIVYTFKYKNYRYAAIDMGNMLAMEMQENGIFSDVDCLVPVPLTRRRMKNRGYNQSEELARGISKVTGIPVYGKALKRKKFSVSQTSLTHEERIFNVETVFELGKDSEKLADKHVMIIDDVITTGSTTSACASCILKIRGTSISMLSLGCIKNV